MEKTSIRKEFIASDENMYMSPWKFIKWAAQNKTPLKKRFYRSLPLALMELYSEFQPVNIALRTASHQSKAYHKALYLQNAQALLEEFSELKPTAIYHNPRMQNVQRWIWDLGGKYKKRTFVESWLPEVVESSLGRPRKQIS